MILQDLILVILGEGLCVKCLETDVLLVSNQNLGGYVAWSGEHFITHHNRSISDGAY